MVMGAHPKFLDKLTLEFPMLLSVRSFILVKVKFGHNTSGSLKD
jgi:hypothetical protein